VNKEDVAELCCSFCGTNQHQVKKLIAGPNVYICDACIALCNDIIAEEVDRGNDLQEALRIRAERHDDALGRLEELSNRLGENMPVRIRDAIRAIRSASSELKSAVALSLPEVPPAIQGPSRTPSARNASLRVKDHWPLLSSLLGATAALLSRPEDLPEELPNQQEIGLRAAIVGLSDLVQFLERHGGHNRPATPTPRD
jgi:hypothetical protein